MRPESIDKGSMIIDRMRRRACARIDVAASLYKMGHIELHRLNARPLQLAPQKHYAISASLLNNRIAEVGQSKTSAGNPYPYTPIDRLVGEIRLLRMIRNRRNRELAPDFELINAKLEDNMDFMAFSYTWGDDTDQREIVIAGVPVKVRRNLHEIPMHMAQVMRLSDSFEQVDCWFDALCINQNDITEKSMEVRRMSQIYAASECVHAWLGPGTTESTQVLREFAFGRTDLDNQEEKGFMLNDRNRIEHSPDFYVSIAKLVMRPFFTRAWCTQELALARKLRVMAGMGMADWGSLATLSPAHTDWEAYLPLIASIDALPQERLTFFQGTPFARLQLVERLQRRRKSGRPTTLLSLLLATLHLDSTIARDKIYSLWSMASDAAELLPEPTYEQSDKQVFFDFTRAWIMQYGRLDVLSLRAVQREKWVEGIVPTWVTDWSSRRLSRPFLSTYPSALRDEELDDVEESRLYSAAGKTGPCYGIMDPDSPSSRMLASGLSCDVIKFVGEANAGQFRPFGSWFEAMTKERDESEQRLEVENDFSDAMYANRDPAGVRTSNSDRYQSHYLNIVDIFDNNAQGDLEVGKLLWRNHIHQTIVGRRLAVTHNGHVGLVPAEAEVGDEICVLFGCSVPLVLRQDPKGSKLIVGDCYFRRMMDGQMVEAAGGANFCMTHAMPGMDMPAETRASATPEEAVAGTAKRREARNQQGFHFREPDAVEELPVMQLPSGKVLDRVPGQMMAEVSEHSRENITKILYDACFVRPTPGEAVRIQPFIIA